jgi:hypothetical protein
MTLSQSGKVCAPAALYLGSPSATPNMAADCADGAGGGADLRLVESIPAAARSLRKAGGHSRGIPIHGVRSDLLEHS